MGAGITLAVIGAGPSTSLGVNGQPTPLAVIDAGTPLPDPRKRPPVKPPGEIKSTDLEDTL